MGDKCRQMNWSVQMKIHDHMLQQLSILVVDVGSTKLVQTFTPCRKDDGENLTPSEPPITKMFTSADGQWLVSINCFGDVYIFDLETLRQHWYISRLDGASITTNSLREIFIDVGTMISPTVHARRSLCYLMCEQPDIALRNAMQAQCIYPEWSTSFYMQAVALTKLDMHKDAADMLNEAAALDEKKQ